MKIKIMKGEMIMRELTYQQMGDYQVPQVALPQTKKMTQGRFSRMREKFLKEHKRGLYEELMLDGKMEEHLGEIEETAQNRLKLLIKQLAEKAQVNEEMKRADQMGWVQAMNAIRNQAEEMIITELIYN
ncbi:MAG: TnpV protein [Bacilli bacterium]